MSPQIKSEFGQTLIPSTHGRLYRHVCNLDGGRDDSELPIDVSHDCGLRKGFRTTESAEISMNTARRHPPPYTCTWKQPDLLVFLCLCACGLRLNTLAPTCPCCRFDTGSRKMLGATHSNPLRKQNQISTSIFQSQVFRETPREREDTTNKLWSIFQV